MHPERGGEVDDFADSPMEIAQTPAMMMNGGGGQSHSSASKQNTGAKMASTPSPSTTTNSLNNPEEFFRALINSFAILPDADTLAKHITKLTEFLHNYTSCFFNHLPQLAKTLKFITTWTGYCLAESEVATGLLDESFSKFFLALLTQLLPHRRDNQIEIEKKFKQANKVFTVDYLTDTSAHFITQLAKTIHPTRTATKTLPLALYTLYVIGNYAHSFRDLGLLIKNIITTATRLDVLNVQLNLHPEWIGLCGSLQFDANVYYSIENQHKINEAELQELTCNLVEHGLMSPSLTDDLNPIYRSFNRAFVIKALNVIAANFNSDNGQEAIQSRILFTFFQKAVSDLLVSLAISSRHPNPLSVLLDGMALFGISVLNKELLRWALPPFLVLCNEQTKALLDGIADFTQKPTRIVFENHFNDILIYIFFNCPDQDPIRLTYEVFNFASEASSDKLFSLFNDPTLTGRFTENCLKHYCVNAQRAFLAISFMCEINPIVHLDPERPDGLLEVPTDRMHRNPTSFRNNIEFRFINYMHRIDSRITRSTDTPEDKKQLIESYALLLRYLGAPFTNRFKMKIYFTIRMLFEYFSKGNKCLLKSVCKIMEEFVANVPTAFLQSELSSICFLILPLAKRYIPQEGQKILQTLFRKHTFPKQIYHQLFFMHPDSSNLSILVPIQEHIRKQTGSVTFIDRTPVPNVEADLTGLIDYVENLDFGSKCREILFILGQVNHDNTMIQQMALLQLYHVLNLNIDLFHQLLYPRIAELRIYEDLGEIRVKVLRDGFDGESQYEPEMLKLLESIDTVRAFFQTLIIRLLQCLKFSTSEIACLVANCLGLLGAIDPHFLALDGPSLSQIYENESPQSIENKSSSQQQQQPPIGTSLDFSYHRTFRHQKRPFKLLTLELLMKIVKQTTSTASFTWANLALQELVQLFTTTTSSSPEALLIDKAGDCKPIDSNGRIVESAVSSFIQKMMGTIGTATASTQNQEKRIDKLVNDLEIVLKDEKVECVRKSTVDLSQELLEYMTTLETATGMYEKKKRINYHPNGGITMEQFFESVNPTMSYYAFAKQFLQMLYHCFIVEHCDSQPNDGTRATAEMAARQSTRMNFHHQLFSQCLSQSQASSSLANNSQEYALILEKLKSIQTPLKVFELCYHSIFEDPKLAHLLLPSLLILALSYAEDQKTLEHFARHFRSMIIDKLLLNGQFFAYELGPMVAELIYFIYDYLVAFVENRQRAHQYVIPRKVLRKRVHRFDNEYASVTTLLKYITWIDIARLAITAGAPHKALFYLETAYAQMRDAAQVPPENDEALYDFLQEHYDLMLSIFTALNDEDAVSGCQDLMIPLNDDSAALPTLQELQSTALASKDHCGALMIADLMARSVIHQGTRYKIPTGQHRQYFTAIQRLQLDHLHLSRDTVNTTDRHIPFSVSSSSQKHSPAIPQYMIDATRKLNEWDTLEPLINSVHILGGLPNAAYEKLDLNIHLVPPKKRCLHSSFGSADVSTTTFAPNIGTVLYSLKKTEPLAVFQTKLADIQTAILGPLRAALLTNQQNAYQRAYVNSIIPIHFIHDVQQFSQTVYGLLLQESSPGQSNSTTTTNNNNQEQELLKCFNELRASWETRNRLLPSGGSNSNTLNQVLEIQRALLGIVQHHWQQKKFTSNSDPIARELFHYWTRGMTTELECGNLGGAFTSMLQAFALREQLMKRNRSFTFSHEETAQLVLNSAKVRWYRRESIDALRMLKSEIAYNYKEIHQICCSEIAKRYLGPNNEAELRKLSRALSFSPNIPLSAISKTNTHATVNSNNSVAASTVSTSATQQEVSRMQLEAFGPSTLQLFGQLQLQYARYAEVLGHFPTNILMTLYRSVNMACPKWEEGHYAMATYCSSLIRAYEEMLNCSESSETKAVPCKADDIIELKSKAIRAYAEALKYGYKYMAISLPMMLRIWLDLGYEAKAFDEGNSNRPYLADIADRSTSTEANRLKQVFKRTIARANSAIHDLVSKGNNVIFLSVVDTLLAHIMHPYPSIVSEVQDILARLTTEFPHHLIWQLSRSEMQLTTKRGCIAKEIFEKAKASAELHRYHNNFRVFTNTVNDLARYKPPQRVTNVKRGSGISNNDLSLRKAFPRLIGAVETLRGGESMFMLPTNRMFSPSQLNLERTSSSNKEAFSKFFGGLVVEMIEDEVQVMKSLQMPKKISFICADGVKRSLLCKTGDDLRKDRCFLNFANLFNQCYSGEVPSMEEPMRSGALGELKVDDDWTVEKRCTKRRANPLKLQTYFVCPIHDSFGVIEWIPGLVPLKVLIESQYTRTRVSKNAYIQAKANYMRNACAGKGSKEKRVENFRALLPRFTPPVFHLWFQSQFADAYSWAMAKRNFTRTSAAYSMLGYILGLGDRHSENLLLNPATGEVVQVDFNCLFNHGEDFIVPETVPFRLTHNMISAMGLLGFEGQFRYTAEDVLFLLRQYRKLFAANVNIFLYDPLQEWLAAGDRGEQREKAVFGVVARLAGIVSRSRRQSPSGQSISVSGQVGIIIKEATDMNNLGAMYHGWAPYI